MLSCRYQKRTARTAQDSVASANEVAEEALSLARVVRTFGTEKEEVARSTSYIVWTVNKLTLISRDSQIHAVKTTENRNGRRSPTEFFC